MADNFAGKYAFRFSGFSMGVNIMPYHIVGLGYFQLDGQGGLTGNQKSSITPLWGSGSQLVHSDYELVGKYEFDRNGQGWAEITFTSESKALQGRFEFQVAGSDRFFMISTGAVDPGTGSVADEVVSGEAVRILDI